jgi:hypothetical protein
VFTIYLRFTSSIIFPHFPPFLLEKFPQVSSFYFHTGIQNTTTMFASPLPFTLPIPTGTHPWTGPVLPPCPLSLSAYWFFKEVLPWYFMIYRYMYMYISWFNQINILSYFLFSITLLPNYSAAYSVLHYIIFISRCSILQDFSLSTFSLPFLHPQKSTQTDSLIQSCSLSAYVYYIRSYMYLCVHITYGFSFYIWGKTCDLWLFEPDLLHLTWCSPVLSIYLQATQFHSSFWLNINQLCIYIYTTFS